jgi:hypothetical protein
MLSKILVILTTGVVSGLIVTLPVLGLRFNYFLALLLILVSGFFASSLGLLIAGYFREITKAFGTIFLIIFILMVPVISYFLPGWNPLWVRFIPSDFVIQGFKSIMLASDTGFVLLACTGLLAAGAALFLLAERRFRRTLSI